MSVLKSLWQSVADKTCTCSYFIVGRSELMGNYYNKKILSSTSSRELDPLKASSKLDVMAERISSDIDKQQISEKINSAFAKIETGFREFHDFAPFLLNRQRELEADLKRAQDR